MGINFYAGRRMSKHSMSYSGFHYFRRKIAEAFGYNIKTLYHGSKKLLDGNSDKLMLLLNQLDTEAKLTSKECKQLYNRLLDAEIIDFSSTEKDFIESNMKEFYENAYNEFMSMLYECWHYRKIFQWH